MRDSRSAVDLASGVRLQVPAVDRPYPGLSSDLADVVAGPNCSLLGIWCDAEERRSQEYTANYAVTPAEESLYRIEVVAQYSTDGSIIVSWCLWTNRVTPEYRVLPDGKLLVFSQASDGSVEAAVMDEVGDVMHSGRLGPEVNDVAVLDDGSLVVAYDKYFRDGEDSILGLAQFNTELKRTAIVNGAGVRATELSAASGVIFWDRNSALIMSSELELPIWPDTASASFGEEGPTWVLNTPGSNRWALVGAFADTRFSTSVPIVVGMVDERI
ncbi:MAG: hypothetical protein ACQEVD_06315 [Actinomycetota bacterium]